MKLYKDYVVSLSSRNLYWYNNIDNDFIVNFGWNEQYNIWSINTSNSKLFDIYIGKAPYKALEAFGIDNYYTDFFITFRDAYNIPQPLEYKLKVGLSFYQNNDYTDEYINLIYNVPYVQFGLGSEIAIIDFSFDFINYSEEYPINLFSNIAFVNGADSYYNGPISYLTTTSSPTWTLGNGFTVGNDFLSNTSFYNFHKLNLNLVNYDNISPYSNTFINGIYSIAHFANDFQLINSNNFGYGLIKSSLGTSLSTKFIVRSDNFFYPYSTYSQKGESFNNFMINTRGGDYFVDFRYLVNGNYTFGNGGLWFVDNESIQSKVFDDNNRGIYDMNIFRGLLKNSQLDDYSTWDSYSIKLLGVNTNFSHALVGDAPSWLAPFNAITAIEIGSGVTFLTLIGVAICFFGVNIFRKLFS